MLVVERPARHGCVNPLERRRRCDRPVAAERQPSAAILERAKCVSGPRALGSNYFLSPTTVVDGMIRLHARNDAKLSEARDISWCDMLRVLDPKAPIAIAVLLLYALVDRKNVVIRTIADGVNDYLQTCLVGAAHAFEHRAFGKHLVAGNAVGIWRIVVGLKEKRGSRTQTPVRETFQTAGAQHRTAEVRAHARLRQTFPTRQRPHRVNSVLEFATI